MWSFLAIENLSLEWMKVLQQIDSSTGFTLIHHAYVLLGCFVHIDSIVFQHNSIWSWMSPILATSVENFWKWILKEFHMTTFKSCKTLMIFYYYIYFCLFRSVMLECVNHNSKFIIAQVVVGWEWIFGIFSWPWWRYGRCDWMAIMCIKIQIEWSFSK